MRYNHRVLRRLRRQAGIDMRELARRARIAKQTVVYLEQGVSAPNAKTLAKLADALGVSVDVFFEKTAEKTA